jgi:hypothetical protein
MALNACEKNSEDDWREIQYMEVCRRKKCSSSRQTMYRIYILVVDLLALVQTVPF